MTKRTHYLAGLTSMLALSLGATHFVAAADHARAGEAPGGAPLVLAQMGGTMKGMAGCGENMATMMDADKDGKVSKDEFTKHHDEMFAQMDTDKNGAIDPSERGQMGKMMESHCGGMGMHKGMDG